MIKNQQLKNEGRVIAYFPVPEIVLEYLQTKNWKDLDQFFLRISGKEGLLRQFLSEYLDFETLEHIISIRRSPYDEDGIWHDDGSRFLGFSLSLNQNPLKIKGGSLFFKKKNAAQKEEFPPQPLGTMILFLSGIYGYEHMVSAVTEGERVVIAGWCS